MKVNVDREELQDWLDAFDSLLDSEGPEYTRALIKDLLEHSQQNGVAIAARNTPYINTLKGQVDYPGNLELENQINNLLRWNAMILVTRAERDHENLGGHIGTYASALLLYEMGFNHFWHAPSSAHGGDLIYIQGHSSPGIYARSFLEGRLTVEDLLHFRREAKRADGRAGLSSYPHPWLMPEYWQFPTVSMGLGPIQAIYQARFLKYLEARKISTGPKRYVWCFCGDGEMDEPESLGALSIAARENLDNLIFVINCNLQRLDGPVRGNSKIIQELERIFAGAGWDVLKVIWGSNWDKLLHNSDNPELSDLLIRRMEETVDGDYQNYVTRGGKYIREHFFGKYPELLKLVENYSDQELQWLTRGGHDPQKVYTAYQHAVESSGKPTVILAKTIKGYALGSAGEGLNTAHNTKKLTSEQVADFCRRLQLNLPEQVQQNLEFYKPDDNHPAIKYLLEQRKSMGGNLPQRRTKSNEEYIAPPLTTFAAQLEGSGDRQISTTMAFVRILISLCKYPDLGPRVVPIIADEGRTFGMEGLFRQLGIYSPLGQQYQPVDSDQVMFYKEAQDGQILQEGINESGAFCSWMAAATSYSVNDHIMLPLYIFYSMFGFQRISDLIWAAADARARGFLLGATAGRTTLNGEGLQHEDGHSHLIATTVPNCMAYDPAFAYELAVIMQYGIKQMIEQQKDHFYYITIMNENYVQPPMPKELVNNVGKQRTQEQLITEIINGIYHYQQYGINLGATALGQVNLFGSGAIMNEVIAAAEILANDYQISSHVFSVTSYNQLARDGQDKQYWQRRNPVKKAEPYLVTQSIINYGYAQAPIIAASDYICAVAEQIRGYVPEHVQYTVLGTDGFGRSDTRAVLREFFGVDRAMIVITALESLVKNKTISVNILTAALAKYNIAADLVHPRYR